MSWNLEHLYNNPEHSLFESLVDEFTQISGFSVDYYIVKQNINKDKLYGEFNRNITYYDSLRTKMIYEVTMELTSYQTFGMFPQDEIQYIYIPKISFNRDIKDGLLNRDGISIVKPQVGDVIHTLWNNYKYIVVDVGMEDKIFQGKKLIYEIILKPYEYSKTSEEETDMVGSDPFDIGFEILDNVSDPLSAGRENEWIEKQSEEIFDYDSDSNVDSDYYGYD